MIYKIVSLDQWEAIASSGRFDGSPVDARDGFIHFSSREQLAETLARHFSGQDNLVVFGVDPSTLGDALKWEPSRGGQLFPHLYGPVERRQISEFHPVGLDATGSHRLPEALTCDVPRSS